MLSVVLKRIQEKNKHIKTPFGIEVFSSLNITERYEK
jgi:hypothetical protein